MSRTLRGFVIKRGTGAEGTYAKVEVAEEDYKSIPLGEFVVLVPIDDESLPHPGDGKEWEWHGDLVRILTPPLAASRGTIIVVEKVSSGDAYVPRFDGLRERKPEPEHRQWCEKRRMDGHPAPEAVYPCTCERRSGEERRKGERRDTPVLPPQWTRGRRSGTDRRQS